jgi:hypothetical protein
MLNSNFNQKQLTKKACDGTTYRWDGIHQAFITLVTVDKGFKVNLIVNHGENNIDCVSKFHELYFDTIKAIKAFDFANLILTTVKQLRKQAETKLKSNKKQVVSQALPTPTVKLAEVKATKTITVNDKKQVIPAINLFESGLRVSELKEHHFQNADYYDNGSGLVFTTFSQVVDYLNSLNTTKKAIDKKIKPVAMVEKPSKLNVPADVKVIDVIAKTQSFKVGDNVNFLINDKLCSGSITAIDGDKVSVDGWYDNKNYNFNLTINEIILATEISSIKAISQLKAKLTDNKQTVSINEVMKKATTDNIAKKQINNNLTDNIADAGLSFHKARKPLFEKPSAYFERSGYKMWVDNESIWHIGEPNGLFSQYKSFTSAWKAYATMNPDSLKVVNNDNNKTGKRSFDSIIAKLDEKLQAIKITVKSRVYNQFEVHSIKALIDYLNVNENEGK